ncbi:MAG: hypothetical protein FWC64_01695 [Treponema sp.]|nr:hypothetical protein [Treponema sp.]
MDLVNLWSIGRNSVYLNDTSQRGGSVFTGNELDFYSFIGFFVVFDDINNVYYLTRNGRFIFNIRNFLVNEDGYYVLNINGGLIHRNDIDLEQELPRNFNDSFLIAIPEDTNDMVITSRYIITPNFSPVTYRWVSNMVLETVPFNLRMLLEKAILDTDNNENFENKEGLINLMRKRFFQAKEWDMMLPDNSDFRTDAYASMDLLNKIEIIERKLLSNLYPP